MQRQGRMIPAARTLLMFCLAAVLCGPLVAQEASQPASADKPASATDAKTESPATAPQPAAATTKDAPATSATKDAPAAAPKPVPMSQRPETIEKFMQYYLDMYSLHLKSPDWMARAMGVISLARLDDPRATQLLMQAMLSDKEELVRIYAWEAVHGRQDRLTPDQRYLWVRTGFDLHRQKALRGDLRLAIVGLMEAGGPTIENRQLFKDLFKNTNSINPSDIHTLHALGDTLTQWRNRELIDFLLDAMKDIDSAYRAEVVLRRFSKDRGKDIPPPATNLRMQSWQVMWGTTRKRWQDYFEEKDFKEILQHECKPYDGLSRIMPHGWKITDTADPRWRQDLELRKFHLDQLDVGLVLDTTASMGRPLHWVKHDVVKMMRAFEMISREPRIGVTLYRDKGDEYVTRSIPLTGSAKSLAKALAPHQPKGGGDVPEAAYEGLEEMIKKQKWSPSSTAKKVILLISDAPPQQDSLPKIEQLLKEALNDRFLLHAIKVRTSKYVERRLKLENYDPELKTFDDIGGWGNGTSVWVEFWTQSSEGRWQGTAQAASNSMAERVIFSSILRSVLEDGYRDRVDPFINVLLEYVEEPWPEKREPFGKAGPSRPGGPPSNPQMNR